MLLQGDSDNKRPVVYISRKLFPRENRYAAVELEPDHSTLQWLGRMKDSNVRVTRGFLALQPYRFAVKYRAGAENTVADFLSC